MLRPLALRDDGEASELASDALSFDDVLRSRLIEQPRDGVVRARPQLQALVGRAGEFERVDELLELVIDREAEADRAVGQLGSIHGFFVLLRGPRRRWLHDSMRVLARINTCVRFYTYTRDRGRGPVTDVDQLGLDEAAAIHDALGHPIRIAIQRALREQKRMSMPELRKAVSEAYIPIDTRNLQFHLFKMQVAGVVRVTKVAGRDTVVLVRDVKTRLGKGSEPA